MRCRPGDLAVFVRETKSGASVLGKICTIIHAAPQHEFNLPDGYRSAGVPQSYWVVKFPNAIELPIEHFDGSRGFRSGRYATAPDFVLRPLRDNPGEDETLTRAPKREPLEVA